MKAFFSTLAVVTVVTGVIAACRLIYWLSNSSTIASLSLTFISAAGIILILLLFGFGGCALLLANEIHKEDKRIERERQRQQTELEILKAQVGGDEVQLKRLDIEGSKILDGIKKEILLKWIETNGEKPPETKEMKKIWDELGKALDEYVKELFKKRE